MTVASPPTPPWPPAETPPATPAAGAAPPGCAARGGAAGLRAGRSRRGWFVLGGVVVLALLIGIVVAGGRLRDGLGVAFTLLAVVFVVALRRRGDQAGRLRALVLGSLAARRCSSPAAQSRRAASSSPAFSGGCRITRSSRPPTSASHWTTSPRSRSSSSIEGSSVAPTAARTAVDGDVQDTVAFPLGGGDGRELTLSLPERRRARRRAPLARRRLRRGQGRGAAGVLGRAAPDRPVAGQAGRRCRPYHLGQEHR